MREVLFCVGGVLTPEAELCPATVGFESESGLVTRLERSKARGALDLGEHIVVPGFVDLHVHGGGGAEVNGDTPDEVVEACRAISAFHGRHGTTSMCLTTVSDTPIRLAATLEGIARTARDHVPGARIAGAHLEGPFIAPGKSGAQDPERLRLPDTSELGRLLEAGGGLCRMITLAPELPGAFDLIEASLRAGLVVSLGHSECDFDIATRAIAAGARHITHLFNAMSTLHHRRPGLVGAALASDAVTVEVIADLEHLHPVVLGLVARLAPSRLVAVTDAAAPAGLEAGDYRLGPRKVRVDGARVALATDPSVLAGTLLTMERAVSNLSARTCLGLTGALAAATSTPARHLPGLPGLGRLEVKGVADLVILTEDLSVAATVVGGRIVHDPGGLFA